MDKIVTFDGSVAQKSECRFIKGDYYKIGNPSIKDSGQCFKLLNNTTGESKYYRINSGYVEFDHEQNEYVLKNQENLIQGYVDKKGTIGFFTPNQFKNVYVQTEASLTGHTGVPSTGTPCIDAETAEGFADFHSLVDGFYYYLNPNYSEEEIKLEKAYHEKYRRRTSTRKILYNKFEESYNAAESNMFKYMIDTFEESPIDTTEKANQIDNLLGGLSFGYECETNSGRVPEKELYLNGVLPLRDGSINGHEYTSIPLRSSKGVQAMINFFNVAKDYCGVDQSCSLHFHIGNVFKGLSLQERKELMIAIYMLYYQLQGEIWEIVPPYKRSNDYFKTKRDFKDHCQPLRTLGLMHNRIINREGEIDEKELERSFADLFRFLNDGRPACSDYNIKTRTHHKAGAAKWNITSRYYALNLYNAAFSKSDTVEFRAYSGTVNPDKAVSLLLISAAIIRFAKENTREILAHKNKYNLEDIVYCYTDNFGQEEGNKFYEFVAQYLINFIRERKSKFLNAFFADDLYANEFKDDYKFSFSWAKQKLYE